MDQLTKTQKALGAFILEHLSECAFATLEEIAQQSGVSTASIIRFARKLGFTGFPELKEKIQEEFRDSVTTATKLERRIEMFSGSAQVLRELLEMEGEQASRLITEELALNYAAAVQKLASVRELILYGEGASATLTYLLEFRFRRFGYRVTRINESGRYFFDAVLNLPRDGAAVVCGLGRPPRERQFFLRRAKKCKHHDLDYGQQCVRAAGGCRLRAACGRTVRGRLPIPSYAHAHRRGPGPGGSRGKA